MSDLGRLPTFTLVNSSGDGEEWASLGTGFSFAVAPVLVPYEPGMVVKSLHGGIQTIPPAIDPYLEVGPNPFNPRTEIRIGHKSELSEILEVWLVQKYQTAP